MKKIYLLAIAAIIGTAAFSQVKWGVQASGNLNTAALNSDLEQFLKKDMLTGFGVALVSDVSLSKQLSLRSSINLLQKGSKMKTAFDFGDGGGDAMFPEASVINRLYYAELPATLVYNVNLSKGKFFFGAGPSVGYGLFGKAKVTAEDPFNPGQKETQSLDAFKKEDDGGAGYKRFDLSANAIAGYQWNSGLYVNAGYLLGFSNLVDSDDEQSYKNRGIQLSIGYFFKK